ncbi:MAG TPA: glycoside hydrolase family 15 protein [Chloroflexota bacterium]|nr:glycoside hydrolase family 15 protein [Chloroflexota bacterium]
MAAVRYSPIADYALLGDCHTAALVSRGGSLDWYCPHRFDAPAVFCRLLDADQGGYWALIPTGPYRARRRYLGPTPVLETTFTTAAGTARVIECMPVYDRKPNWGGHDVGSRRRVLRLVEGLAGETTFATVFKPTFDYARVPATLSPAAGGAIASGAGTYLVLACAPVALAPDGQGGLHATFSVRAGERRALALTVADSLDSARAALAPPDPYTELAATLDYWQRWAARCTYHGPYRDLVLRSALTLKLLTYEPTGAIVAAPTTSLPEEIGGTRNWDYRYTWLRDSSLMLYALLSVGYEHEAVDFFLWLRSVCLPSRNDTLQIMYTIDGGRELPEYTLDHLEGYRGSRPVRVGNAAATQQQQDIYGEVLTTAYLYYRPESGAHTTHGQPAQHRPGAESWQLLSYLVEQAASRWSEPGAGIWEMRGPPQHFLYSKLLCWAALDRGIRLATEFGLPAPLARWHATREAIRAAILEQGWNPRRGAFTQAFGSDALDASALALPRVGFLPASDPRVRATVAAIQRELAADGLVRRYRAPDGLPGSEGAFLLCSFWLVDALAYEGRVDEARALFERLTRYGNDLGLFSEEVDARDGSLLGNFPQGFTHLALIGSAVNLAAATQGQPETAARTEGDRVGPARQAAATAAPPTEQ